MNRRLGGADRTQWLAARTGLDAALAETVALAADDVLLDELLVRLDQVPGAAALLMGVSVYREPVDLNAVLFQAGQPDPDAEHLPDRRPRTSRSPRSSVRPASSWTIPLTWRTSPPASGPSWSRTSPS